MNTNTAFITNHTYSKLCRNLNIKNNIDLETFKNHIYNDSYIYYIFNKLELRYLFNSKNLLQSDEKYISEYYNHVPIKNDSKSFVFEKEGRLKYHLDNNCEFLRQDYINFYIPEDIRSIGENAISDFRSWFKTKRYAESYFNGKLDVSKVVFDFNMRFPKKYKIKPLNEKYKLVIELGNSDISDLNSLFNFDDFEKNIKTLKNKRENRLSCKTAKKLSKFDYLLNKTDHEISEKISEVFSEQFLKNYGLKNLKDLFKFSKGIKKEILKNLIEYFKWSYRGGNLSMKRISLEHFGLECCKKCSNI